MSSAAQQKANRINAKKSSGPKTKTGMTTSSQNAIKNGATSQRLISAQEKKEYEDFLNALRAVYPSTHPLVMLQLERIAKARTQLARINRLFEAALEAANNRAAGEEALMDKIGLFGKAKENALLQKDSSSYEEILNADRIQVLKELNRVDYQNFASQQSFLDHTPLFCTYLHQQSNQNKASISRLIQLESSSLLIGNDIERKITQLIHKVIAKFDDKFNPLMSMKQAILTTSIGDLQLGSAWLSNAAKQLDNLDPKLLTYQLLKTKNLSYLSIDYEALDKLTRYQSTIQKQLSSFIGELIVINKNSDLTN